LEVGRLRRRKNTDLKVGLYKRRYPKIEVNIPTLTKPRWGTLGVA
jgi:hypothetical protein